MWSFDAMLSWSFLLVYIIVENSPEAKYWRAVKYSFVQGGYVPHEEITQA